MESLELLNSQKHAAVRMRKRYGTPTHFVRIVASEFAAAATACPILFSKHPDTGAFYAGAVMGLKPGECLIDSPDGTLAFRSLEGERDGFFASDEHIAIDTAHARFSATDGEPLFESDGAPGAALRRAQGALGRLMAGVGPTDAFIQALLRHRLIEPIDIALSFDDGERLTLEGLYTVSLDALGELDDAAVLGLFRDGHLQLAYTMIGSLQQISVLARRRNERLAEAG